LSDLTPVLTDHQVDQFLTAEINIILSHRREVGSAGRRLSLGGRVETLLPTRLFDRVAGVRYSGARI
jgi:hypothetical protein